MENNIAVQLHQKAMDLYDFGKIFKAKGYPDYYYEGNLEMAFWLDKEAALRIQTVPNEEVRYSAYPRSAGWLAYKSGRFIEAKQLAKLGLSHKASLTDYEKLKLTELLSAANHKIEELALTTEKESYFSSIIGVVTSANIDEEYLQIRQIGQTEYQLIKVVSDNFLNIARLFLGETVEIELKKDEKGEMILKDIRRAA